RLRKVKWGANILELANANGPVGGSRPGMLDPGVPRVLAHRRFGSVILEKREEAASSCCELRHQVSTSPPSHMASTNANVRIELEEPAGETVGLGVLGGDGPPSMHSERVVSEIKWKKKAT
ncbi:hypothetical protein FRC06_002683, partial [Ceratobasidium sp. 370]